MRLQRFVQGFFLAAFLVLLAVAADPLPEGVRPDWLLRFDPLIGVGSMLGARELVPGLFWALIFLVLAFLLGRVFCGFVCPLGTTLDVADALMRLVRARPATPGAGGRQTKYTLLAVVLGAALAGVGLVFFLAPLAILTRFAVLALFPPLLLLGNLLLGALRPLAQAWGWQGLAFAHLDVPVYQANLWAALLFAAVVLLGWRAPRFWCRHLCPAGALLALCGRRPLVRRTVSPACTECGRCVRACPMGAIAAGGRRTHYAECLTCLQCQRICPVDAIAFGWPDKGQPDPPVLQAGRRQLLAAGLLGLAGAGLMRTQPRFPSAAPDGRLWRPAQLVRPPGALPEYDFQALCVRCGECLQACPTNTLQPLGFVLGLSGLWTPAVYPRIGGCEQNCNRCGQVCPTGAVRPLSLTEKPFAKIGTARILNSRCIAWEQDRTCLVCDEICPYNAITSQAVPGHPVTVPVIDERRCNGCGYCENKCPVEGEAAIVVEGHGELRLAAGSYAAAAHERGLVLRPVPRTEDHAFTGDTEAQSLRPGAGPPDGGRQGAEGGLPPGFILDP